MTDTEAKPIAWSHSRLETFKNCPKRFYHQYVVKDIQDTGVHPAAAWGSEVHEAIELNIRDGKPMPSNMTQYQVYADLSKQLPNVEAEVKMAVDMSWQPVAFDDYANAWGRAISDVLSVAGDTAVVFDWKTGKYRGGTEQAAINAVLTFATYPEVNVVHSRFVYFKEGISDAGEFHRHEIPALIAPTMETLSNIRQCNDLQAWPTQPSGLCGYCPVRSCQYNRT